MRKSEVRRQKSEIDRLLEHFFKQHLDPSRPVLLALSGGPDSVCLFHLLLDFRRTHGLDLHVAHVDHGWRPVSAQEAEQLRQQVTEQGIPFHLYRLEDADRQGNLELAAREARLRFFAALCQQHQCQAVLLGHQTDDVQETVLKRVLEGASLAHLSGLQPVRSLNGLTLWRPLLECSKQSILDYLASKNIVAFTDHTNLDPQYLRGKMRSEILPTLSKQFGKEICNGLTRVAADSDELRLYLDEKIAPHLSLVNNGPLGTYIDLSFPIPALELRYLIRNICESHLFYPSREILAALVTYLQQRLPDKQFLMRDHKLVADRGRFFVIPRSLPPLPDHLPLTEGTQSSGLWQVTVQPATTCSAPHDWKNLWDESSTITLPQGDYHLGIARLSSKRQLPSGLVTLGHFWTSAKVPACLRYLVPVLYKDDVIHHDFLTGRQASNAPSTAQIQISITGQSRQSGQSGRLC